MTYVTITIRAVAQGQAFWEHEATVSEGDAINVNTDKMLGQLMAERELMHTFIKNCAKKDGAQVDGTKLATAANNLLERCPGSLAPDVEGSPA